MNETVLFTNFGERLKEIEIKDLYLRQHITDNFKEIKERLEKIEEELEELKNAKE